MRRYIRESELRAITAGSFEARRSLAVEAIDAFENGSAQIRAQQKLTRPTALVATFEQHAVVLDANGNFHRYSFQEGHAVAREAYPDFIALSEEQAKKSAASIAEAAATDLVAGKDVTRSIVELMRR